MRTVNKCYKFNCNYIIHTKIILNLLNNIVNVKNKQNSRVVHQHKFKLVPNKLK